MKCKIFVSHRIDNNSLIIKNDVFTPVYCGSVFKDKQNKYNNDILNDNTGANISKLRSSLGELTVEYWVWKNIDLDFYGLCHYRRYFAHSNFDGFRNEQNQIYLANLNEQNISKYKIGDIKEVNRLCMNYDVIVPEAASTQNIVSPKGKVNDVLELWQAHEGMFFGKNILQVFLNVLKENDNEFFKIALSYLHSKQHIGYNCYLMKKKYFYELCNKQFYILNKVIDSKEYKETRYKYPRTLGYLGEIVFGCYIHQLIKEDKAKIHYLPLAMFENTEKNKISIVAFKNFCRYLLKSLYLRLNYNMRVFVKNIYYKIKKER